MAHEKQASHTHIQTALSCSSLNQYTSLHSDDSPCRADHFPRPTSRDFFITRDGTQLPLKTWRTPPSGLKAVIIAIHGFNDYSNFFQLAGVYFSQHQTISYAYDQRGFGGSPNRGLWAGIDTYTKDLNCFIQLIKHRHPSVPLYLLGESMGAAIIISAITRSNNQDVNGIILVAPAIWARQTMPWYQSEPSLAC